jgi:hypothetical protein
MDDVKRMLVDSNKASGVNVPLTLEDINSYYRLLD